MGNKLADRGNRPHRAPHNKFASGRFAYAISDRSGLAFPYNEMVFEWNGSFVHVSEFEPKQPQLDLTYFTDAESLENARPQANVSQTGGVPDQIEPIFPPNAGYIPASGIATIPTNWYTANTNLLSMALGSVTVVTS
tara:strand:- start:50 stop:460 length:411 start_codon:yes stop_codon:yes gene_type:complete